MQYISQVGRLLFSALSLLCVFNKLVFLFMSKCSYVGNIHPQVTEPLLQEVFATAGPLEGCKLIRKEKVRYYCTYFQHFFLFDYNLLNMTISGRLFTFWKQFGCSSWERLFCQNFYQFSSYRLPFLLMQSSYGFVDYFDRRSAAISIVTLNGRHL